VSRWNHSTCDECWNARNPGITPKRAQNDLFRQAEKCCWCGVGHSSGIYVWQMNLNGLLCEGKHEEAA
jgi:hypothetical protein